MDREEEIALGDLFPCPTYNYNYYGSSHLQQFPYYDHSGTSTSSTPIINCDRSEASASAAVDVSQYLESDDEDCIEVQVSFMLCVCVFFFGGGGRYR